MISYKVTCIFCKKDFQILEGTNKYRVYKQNMAGRYSCDIVTVLYSMKQRKL
ncbi:hypothetical protein ABH966_005442 [Lysinibacillus sp. RC46]